MVEVLAPVAGRCQHLSTLPDPVFATGMVGPGVAVVPRGGRQTAVAPVAGTVVKVHPHAFVILHESGRGLLVHLGIDTVRMKGDGFVVHVTDQDRVEVGATIVTWDPDHVVEQGYSAMCAVVVLDCPPEAVGDSVVDTDVAPGDRLFTVTG